MTFTAEERVLLDRVQKDIPLAPDPFEVIARDVGLPARSVIDALARLKEQGVIRNIAGIFDASLLGYTASLVAFSVPQGSLETAADLVSSHPGVSHNYQRDHDYNLWFTLAVEGEAMLEKTVRHLARRGGAGDYLILPNERLFKLGVRFALGDGDDAVVAEKVNDHEEQQTFPLKEPERAAVKLLQRDLPLVSDPFAALVEGRPGLLTRDSLLDMGNALKKRGVLRRYAAVLRHRKAGFTANAMTVWKPRTEEHLVRAAKLFAAEVAVSHLYARTVHPGRWEYPLFAMVHARSEDELGQIVSRFSDEAEIADYLVLRSLREFKKQRVAYYSDDFENWNRKEML
jgi:DNA-binding Lrp family transcriptional regulator